MSKIDKLLILGVRSFDNTRSETIQFYSPLTLVVGYNGSGKTTIIECLKYATTGILPPNSKDGAFIHDPKLAGEREVWAQVKLSFSAPNGLSLVATRSLQLTVKNNIRHQNAVEGQLKIVEEGGRTTKSTKRAELDQLIPQHLGVSTAIIDNVIFCHQDESLWPMSAPAVLKKKFDEIFEAQKYTKAIENIKQLRKRQNEELGKHKIIEQHAKEDKVKAERTEKRMVKLQDDIESLRKQCGQLEEEMRQAAELAHEAHQHYNKYESISTSLKTKQDDAASREQLIASLKTSMTEVSESNEWLEQTLEQFNSRIGQYRERSGDRLEALQELKGRLDVKQRERGDRLADKGRVEAEKSQYEKQLRDRQQTIKDIARRYDLRGYEDVVDNSHFQDFMQVVKKIWRAQSNVLVDARQQADGKRKDAQALVNKLEQRHQALEENKVEARKIVTQNEDESQKIRHSVDSISVDEGSQAVIESRIEDTTKRLSKAEADAENTSRQEALRDIQAQVAVHEEESKQLRERLVQSTKRSDELAELAHLKKLVKDSSRSLDTMTGVHGERIRQTLGCDWSSSTAETMYHDVLAVRNRELISATQDQSIASREVEQCDFRAEKNNEGLKEKEKLLRDSRQKLRDAIDDEPTEYETTLQNRQRTVDSLKEDAGQMAGLSSFMEQILIVANERGLCRTCSRPFRNEAELNRFKTRMEGLVQKAHSETQDVEIKELESELQDTRGAGKHYEMWKQLSAEIPLLKEHRVQLSSERDQALSRLVECDKTLEAKQEAKREVEAIFKTIQSISKHDCEAKTNEIRIEQLSSKQSSTESSWTVDELQEQMNEVETKTRAARDMVQQLTREEETWRREISSCKLELSRLQGELSTSKFRLEKKNGLLLELEKLKTGSTMQRNAISGASQEMGRLDSEIEKARERHKEVEERGKETEADLQHRVDEVSESLQALNYSNGMIQEYVSADGPNQLTKVERELRLIGDEISSAEANQADLTREINGLKEEIAQSETVRRNYSDNLQLRQMTRGLEAVEAEIGDLASRASDVDAAHYREEGNRREREHHWISGQREGKMGEMKTKDNQLAELLAEYESDYKGAAGKYKEAHIRTETSKAAMEDLARYGSALDRAIMTYHAHKMQEINSIIEELWQRTYQGTDVDTILIRSDNENARGNRNYNYRVSMVKQDVEMDMRGRCSAGQKVLASIIIRLALAECFGVNCGLIALDEPTTNLDRDNIRSLAESLHDIIKYRQQQANFQLIVITHDEDFLRHMQCGDFSDYYYRVSRNMRQKSIIERQAIAEVM